MHRQLSAIRASLLGVFVLLGAGLFLFGIFAIGRSDWQFTPTFSLRVQFPRIGGIVEGTRVRVQGINAGMVEDIVPPRQPGEAVTVVVRVDRALRGLIRTDATASLSTQGVVGAKVIEIHPGSAEAPPIATDGKATISGRALELTDVVEQLSDLVARVQRGEGSLGKLIVHDDTHARVNSLLQQGETTLRTLDEDLKAIRTVWPLNTYFERLGMHDGTRILVRPGTVSSRQVLPSERLFQPGEAVLTADGKKQLDEVGAWLRGLRRPGSEVVIAAFTSPQERRELERILTQAQADAVRDYLVRRHSIDTTTGGILGMFNGRKVTAAGLGSEEVTSDPDNATLPRERVEIVVFEEP